MHMMEIIGALTNEELDFLAERLSDRAKEREQEEQEQEQEARREYERTHCARIGR